MHSLRRLSFLIVSFLIVTSSVTVAVADPASEKFIKDRQIELTAAVRSGDRSKVDDVFDAMIDYRAIARDSLGDHWAELTGDQRDQFVCILRNLISDAYHRDLKRTLDYDVKYEGSSKVDRGELVRTVAIHKTDEREEKVRIDYVVYKVGDEQKVRDILTADSSLVGNYSAQFQRIIKKRGFGVLIDRMEKKLGARATACRPK